MDSSKIKGIIVAVLATFAALYLGISAATAQLETVAWVLGGVTLIICLLMGRKIWLLIPLMGSVDISFRVPGLPTTLLIAQLLVIGFGIMLMLMRRLPYRFKITELEWWVILISIMTLQVYLRNPVGINVFGGSSVGGRPYLLMVITLLSTFMVAGMTVPESETRTAVKLSILGGLSNLIISIVGLVVPTIGYWTSTLYATTDDAGYQGEVIDAGAATRVPFLVSLSSNLSLWVSAYRSPLKACFSPLWAPLILVSIGAAGFSGFRSSIAIVLLTYFIGLCYRGRLTQVVTSIFLGMMALVLLAFLNLLLPLPPNVQRALSFLPGTWESRYMADAKGSTDWRVEIWEEVLFTDRWIHNKLLGDGLGFSARELEFQMSLKDAGSKIGFSGFDEQREGILASGTYHSVFVSSVRTVGYIGFVVFFLATIRTAMHAHRLIKYYRDTPHYSTCLFFGIPAIINPLWIPFSALTYLQVVFTTLGMIAIIRLLENSLPRIEDISPAKITS